MSRAREGRGRVPARRAPAASAHRQAATGAGETGQGALCAPGQNQWHKGLQGNNTSGYRGASWNKGRWEARIRCCGQRINLGRYDDPVTAALAYDAAARWLHQAFAGLNFPESAPPLALQAEIARCLGVSALSCEDAGQISPLA